MNINFIPFHKSENNSLIKPIPSLKNLPDWYKAKSPFTDGSKRDYAFPNGTRNVTVKWCNPFGDALGSGYFILLENDIQVRQIDGEENFVWTRGGDGFVGEHGKEQISPELIPEGFSHNPWKFKNFWGIQTPPGYSTLFTHPMNRFEFPFLTLSGVVDTDDYHQPVNFPFVIRKGFEGIIESGTPIAQVIPFKRDSWKANFETYSQDRLDEIQTPFRRVISRTYKRGYWKKKEYK